MEEHAAELVPLLLTVITMLLAGMLWFSRLFVSRLFKKIDELEYIFKEGMDERRKVEGHFYDRVHNLESVMHSDISSLNQRVTAIETRCDYYRGNIHKESD